MKNSPNDRADTIAVVRILSPITSRLKTERVRISTIQQIIDVHNVRAYAGIDGSQYENIEMHGKLYRREYRNTILKDFLSFRLRCGYIFGLNLNKISKSRAKIKIIKKIIENMLKVANINELLRAARGILTS